MSQETTITFDVDLNQQNGKRVLRGVERYLVENGFTPRTSSYDEDWGTISYWSNKTSHDVRNIQNILFNQIQPTNVRVSSEILQHIPMLTLSNSDFLSKKELVSSLGSVNQVQEFVEVTFQSSQVRDTAIEVLKQEGINASTYFNEITLESRNNFSHKKGLSR